MLPASPAPRRQQLRLAVLATGSFALSLLAAGRAAAEDTGGAALAAADAAYFESSVRPVLVDRCYKCHATSSERLRGGLLLDSREGWRRGGDTGAALVPGEPEKSLLVRAVRYDDPKLQMPPGGRLSEREIEALVEWVRRGAPDPRSGAPAPPKALRTIDIEAGREHWAFRPLVTPPVPDARDASWCNTAADRFVLARLETAGLAPNGPTARAALIRRAALDVTGLPPSPDEVDDFLADASPDAYSRLVDRLLASPHHGERWARHWLDLARFAESHGFEHDYDRPTAYHYRDFVIRAFNADLPYDTFVAWQLAGDEVAPDDAVALAATGFLAAGTHSTQITKNQVEKERYDELDDMLATTGTAFLGLTLGCARCHDHKFDPIPTEDYYRLLSTFTTTVRTEQDLDFDPAGSRAAQARFAAEHAPLEKALAELEATTLRERALAWLGRATGESGAAAREPSWATLEIDKAVSAGGATFEPLGDGSLLLTGKNPDHDTQTFTARVDAHRIAGIRLEALAHPSLVKGGPGRAGNGNFALTEMKVAAASVGGGQAKVLTLKDPRATFEQKGLPVRAAIDGDAGSGWAVDPEFGKDHAAVFAIEPPFEAAGEVTLTVTLEFKNNTGHGIGRSRLSIWSEAAPAPLAGDGIPMRIAAILRRAREGGTPPAGDDLTAFVRWYGPRDAEWRGLREKLDAHEARRPKPALQKVLYSSEGVPAVRLHTQGDDFLPETHFLRRGDPSQKAAVAQQGFLRVLSAPGTAETRWRTSPPAGTRTSWRRRALAAWLTDVDRGAGRLLARVIANRLWQHHFGRGIVGTPSDFGFQGERPTHPELLDWLASEVIAGGWRLKRIHKLLLESAAYVQAAEVSPVQQALDPDARLLSHRRPLRLEAEAIRDSILAAGGLLDLTLHGPGTLDPGHRRRSVYFTVKRSQLIPAMTLFDSPDALQGVAARPVTTVAPQALYLLNNAAVRAAAAALSRRASRAAEASADAALAMAYRLTLCREPTAEERRDAREALADLRSSYAAEGRADAAELALADFCQVLFGLNEMVYVE